MGTTYFEWINDTYEFTVYDIGFAFPLIEAGCSSIILVVSASVARASLIAFDIISKLIEFILFWCDN
jgi:hypothetical protein